MFVALMLPAFAIAREGGGCLAALDDTRAWCRLPPLEAGQRQPLPSWARMLADSLPRTTAAMLEIDALHRAHSPLGVVLAGKIRLTVADANRCAYSRAFAQADLRRAGLDELAIAAVAGDDTDLGEKERSLLQFARRLTLEADTITDDDVAAVRDCLGEPNLVAVVLLIAHANFQDRLLLALGASIAANEALPPLEARFAKLDKDAWPTVPARVRPASTAASVVPDRVEDPEWRSLDFAALQRNMQTQRVRHGRIRIPTWEEVANTFPEAQRPKHPVRIQWTLVCRGYQPELAAGWSACLRTFAEESQQDRIFEESVFWVITRTIHCFY